ncbi:MAG: hypothetical protein GF316_17475 [Candidatus Lokiarchaeota archaeon]|nr:hypothetical protein [Candidatus Lokiarchaeota archaeon]
MSGYKITFNITSDPWINNGTIVFVNSIREIDSIVKNVNVESYKIEIEFNDNIDVQEIGNIIHKQVGIDLINKIFTISTPIKFINKELKSDINYSKNEDGYINYKEKITHSEEQIDILKKNNFQNRKTNEIVRVRFNFIGLKREYNKIKKKFVNWIKSALDNSVLPTEEKNKECIICSSRYSKGKTLTQTIFPTISGHHNLKAREFSATTFNLKACPKCIISGLFSLLDPKIIFSRYGKGRNKTTYLYLPIISNFKLLEQFKSNLHIGLGIYEWKDEDFVFYNTNAKRIRNFDIWNLLLTIYCRIINNWTVEKNETQSFYQLLLDIENEEVVKENLTHWIIFDLEKAQVASIKGKRYNINLEIFELVKSFEYEKFKRKQNSNDDNESKIIKESICDIISRVKSPEILRIPEKIAKAVLNDDFHKFSQIFFEGYKKSKKNDIFIPISGFINYLIYYLKVKNVNLNDEDIKAIRTISYTIASALYRDVGLISKLYNATSKLELKRTLGEMFFRLYKRSSKEDSQSISPDKYENILKQINSEDWKELQSLLVSFVCIYSINKINNE